jgi:monovalent cation/proton antiporter MnhG/PhaG subunit
LTELADILASVLLLVGLAFTLLGSIGLVRLPDFYTRMHAPTKATTLGVASMAAAAAVVIPGTGLAKAALIIGFLFLTAPIGAHMMARAARRGRIRPVAATHVDEMPPQPVERAGLGPAAR